jgi:hypothetical protein
MVLGSPDALRINEWMALPHSGDDWFELYNPDLRPVALGGLYLTDTLSEPKKSRLPALTFLEGGGFAQFFADEHPENGADHVNFKLAGAGDSIGLFDANGAATIDAVTFGPQTSGISQGRFSDGQATLVFFPTTPSPDQSNYLPIQPDTDNDGMPDAWESAHGLIVGVNDGALDPDQDGLNNLQEYVAGTEPQNAFSSLRIEALKSEAEVWLRFAAQPDIAYAVQVRTDLTSGAWETLSTIGPQALSRTIEVIDPASVDGARYYRVVTRPPP